MKIIQAIAIAIMSGSAFADPFSMVLTQRNSADTGNVTRVMTVPTAKSLWFYDPTTQLPGYVTLGTGFTFSAGQIALTSAPVNADWASSSGLSQILNKPILATVATSGSYNDLNTKPTFSTVAISGLYADLLSKPTFSTVATSGAYADLTGRPTLATVATSGAYADLTGKPTIPTITAFNFSQPTTRTLALSTSLQATDTTKAAMLYPSYACTNATTVIAASGCTMQVRMNSSAVTCSTGTVYYTQSLTVTLGVLLTQASTNPVPIYLPIGGFFILCPTSGTFTVTAIEQSAG